MKKYFAIAMLCVACNSTTEKETELLKKENELLKRENALKQQEQQQTKTPSPKNRPGNQPPELSQADIDTTTDLQSSEEQVLIDYTGTVNASWPVTLMIRNQSVLQSKREENFFVEMSGIIRYENNGKEFNIKAICNKISDNRHERWPNMAIYEYHNGAIVGKFHVIGNKNDKNGKTISGYWLSPDESKKYPFIMKKEY